MLEEHPSVSAVGSHLDKEIEIAALAQRYYEEEGRPEGGSTDHWIRAEREIRRRDARQPSQTSKDKPTPEDIRTEEAMHLDQ